MKQHINIDGLSDLPRAAREFLQAIGERTPVAFYAPMGAGKTTFITALCKALGVEEDAVSSPTFAIVNEYRGGGGRPIFHFDFYRIKRLEEVYDMGYEDYFYGSSLCLIEWPELIEELLPDDCLRVNIRMLDDGSREISVRQ